jgi:hypothetical protein
MSPGRDRVPGFWRSTELTLVAAAIGAWMPATPARADLPDEIQVYDDSLNRPGQFGLEVHANHSFGGDTHATFPGEITSGDATRLTAEFSYGLGHGFEAGMYLDTVAPKGESLEFAGPKLRLKWVGRQAPDGGVFYGLNFELGHLKSAADPGRPSGELRPIVGVRSADWLAIVNPILDFSLGKNAQTRTPVFNPGLKLGRRVAEGVMLGTEVYREVGPLDHLLPANRQPTEVFLVLDLVRGWLPLNFGIGRGSGGADPWIVKAIFEVPL